MSVIYVGKRDISCLSSHTVMAPYCKSRNTNYLSFLTLKIPLWNPNCGIQIVDNGRRALEKIVKTLKYIGAKMTIYNQLSHSRTKPRNLISEI